MQIYDDVAVSPSCSRHSIRIQTEEIYANNRDYCDVPEELELQPSTSQEIQCPIYENVAELRSLCNTRPASQSLTCPAPHRPTTNRSKSIDTQTSPRSCYTVLPSADSVPGSSPLRCAATKRRNSRDTDSTLDKQSGEVNMDFLKHIPPPPLGNIDKNPSLNSTTSTGSSQFTSSTPKRPMDMRPLSIPIYQMREIKHRRENQRLAIVLVVLTIFVFAFAFSVWYYFPDLERKYRNMTG